MSNEIPTANGHTLIYLSGPITGKPEHGHPVFQQWAEVLRQHGYRVVDPTEHFYGRTDLDRTVYMNRDLTELLMCEVIAMIPGWHKSVGARLEAAVALEAGKRIILLGEALDPTKLNLRTEVTLPESQA